MVNIIGESVSRGIRLCNQAPRKKNGIFDKHHARQGNAEGKRLAYLMPTRQPKQDRVNFIAIKKEKAVTLCSLLPYVYDSYVLIFGCTGYSPLVFA